ncbi:MAG: hypothetical protein KF771_12280 [Burkholderiales bacterium]|nr:hypothetical protein [Burkholderiales bacterium]
MRTFRLLWCVAAAFLSVAQFAGGDLAILAGWGFLLLTVPVGPLWWFIAYPVFHQLSPSPLVQYVGVTVSVLLAYVFWFSVVPAALKWARRSKASEHAL